MQQLGYVDYVRNLKPEQQETLRSEIQNLFPWRAVWNGNSINTNKLVEIFICWPIHKRIQYRYQENV